jgi:hypothetical protein
MMNPDELLAYQIRSALCPIEIYGVSTYSEEEFRWAIKQITQAYKDYDLRFFLDQLAELKELSLYNRSALRHPSFFLSRAYKFLRRTSESLPLRNNTITLTKRIWAIARLTQRLPGLPLPDYEPDFERKIRREIDLLPEQKWSRHCKASGLKFSKAKRGPKPKSK